jgi:hypothetical protein
MKEEGAATPIDLATSIKEYTAHETPEGKTCAQARTRCFDEGKVGVAPGYSEGFALLGHCAENNSHTNRFLAPSKYRCVATSVEGFIQKLAVACVARGYLFYVAAAIPKTVDPKQVDEKLIKKYEITNSKHVRTRRRKRGESSVQYLRFGRFFLLLVTHGRHRFFEQETNVKDVRESPVLNTGENPLNSFREDGKRNAQDGGGILTAGQRQDSFSLVHRDEIRRKKGD